MKNPNSIVLNLGCGLDTRIVRINPPSTVNWFDLDFPDVIGLRELFFTNQEGYQMISSSVTDLNWLEQIPRDKPVMNQLVFFNYFKLYTLKQPPIEYASLFAGFPMAIRV